MAISHGKSNTRLYRIYCGMKNRCRNDNAQTKHLYYDKGITICDEWANDFLAFYNWAINNGYTDELTIDRIDPNGNYEPNNCQWLTRSENSKKAWKDTGRYLYLKRYSGVRIEDLQ